MTIPFDSEFNVILLPCSILKMCIIIVLKMKLLDFHSWTQYTDISNLIQLTWDKKLVKDGVLNLTKNLSEYVNISNIPTKS